MGVQAVFLSEPVGAPPQGRPDPDAALMARVREGDWEAYRQLYEKHLDPIVRYAAKFTGNRARAEELAQDIFLQVYRARERWEPRARFTTWLYTIAHNLCLNEVRRFDYRGRVGPLENADGEPMDLPDRKALAGEELVSGHEFEERLHTLMGELPENQRTALLLSRVEDLRYEEIGAVLGCTEQAVKSLVFRATRRLKEGLKEWIQDDR
ncbi:MAG: sigma-70 family RNA polymerase sigma factor [Candidatus Binatia bacterium]|nr:sigma-70 family RNA polymerase sigma factor [Candidatus Binatia bacterium]